jgi:hypothetical protein
VLNAPTLGQLRRSARLHIALAAAPIPAAQTQLETITS